MIARILAAKYNRGKDWWPFLELPNTSRSQISEAWKGVEQGLAILKGKISVVVGNGEDVQICLNPWVPSIPGGVPQPQLFSRFQDKATLPVKHLAHADGHLWDLHLLHTWVYRFIPAHATAIVAIPPPNRSFAGQMCVVGVP